MTTARQLLSVQRLRSAWAGPYDLLLNVNECVCVLGPSGSGKSALLRLIADMDVCEGQVSLDGVDRSHMSGPAWRRQVVYQSAEPVWWRATFLEHLASVDDERSCRERAAELGLEPKLLDQPIQQLSTGQRQRLALLRTLARRPRVLLLDEPTAALDPQTTLQVEALVKDVVRHGASALWVTHSEEQALRAADRIVRIEPPPHAA